jgi:hypothetical protein
MTTVVGEALDNARAALRLVISDGQPPNGTRPEDCGELAETVKAVFGAYETGSTQAARRVWGALVKTNPSLAKVISDGMKAEPEPIRAATPQITNARDLMAKVFPDIKWVIPDILPEGVTIFAGKPKMGKSWLALNLAIATATGGRALGRIQVEPGSVLYLALEDNERRLQTRMSKLLQGAVIPDRLDLAIAWQRMGDDTLGLAWLVGWIEAHPDARLIVIDTLAKVRPPMGKSSNIYEHDYNTVQGLKAISDQHNVAILIIHHVRKGTSDDPLELISGSFGLSGGVDGAIILARDRGQADAVLHITGRDVEEKELAMVWSAEFALWTIAGDADEYRISKERRQIIDLLNGVRDGLTPKEVADALQRTAGGVKKMLREMLDDGQVKQTGYGRYISI